MKKQNFHLIYDSDAAFEHIFHIHIATMKPLFDNHTNDDNFFPISTRSRAMHLFICALTSFQLLPKCFLFSALYAFRSTSSDNLIQYSNVSNVVEEDENLDKLCSHYT